MGHEDIDPTCSCPKCVSVRAWNFAEKEIEELNAENAKLRDAMNKSIDWLMIMNMNVPGMHTINDVIDELDKALGEEGK